MSKKINAELEAMMKYPAKIINYYDYKEDEEIECSQCNWKGLAKDLGKENYRDLYDASCPKCYKMLLIVQYPTPDEVKQQFEAGNKEVEGDYMGVLVTEAHNKRFQERKLKSPEQLPEIQGNKLDFLWDYKEPPTNDMFKPETVIRYGEVVLWREPAFWEGWFRFNEVKDILKQKYGNRFHSFTPTDASELFLYGDDICSLRKISFE